MISTFVGEVVGMGVEQNLFVGSNKTVIVDQQHLMFGSTNIVLFISRNPASVWDNTWKCGNSEI